MNKFFSKFCIALFAMFLISGTYVTAQSELPVDVDTKLITYKEVVTVEGNKTELFNRAIEWVNKQYKNPTEATKVRDPQTGLIDILHRIELTFEEKGVIRSAGIVEYSMKIELKEGRYRYTITNYTYKQASRVPVEKWLDKSDKAYNPAWDNYLSQINQFSNKLIESLKQGMLPPTPKKVDEW